MMVPVRSADLNRTQRGDRTRLSTLHSSGTLVVVLLLACAVAQAQEERAAAKRIQIAAPGDWKGEQIQLPPSFAPTMAWKGVEEVRFAPGMFKANSPTFFSYVFVFRLESGPEITSKNLEQQLLVYYEGLATTVSKGVIDGTGNAIKLRAIESPPKEAKGGRQRFSGEVKWTEPFVTRKPQTLRVEVDAWSSKTPKRSYLFFCVSPQPLEHAIWKQMRSIRNGFVAGAGRDGQDR